MKVGRFGAITSIILTASICLAVPARALAPRGAVAKAAMYATSFERGKAPIQILDRLCSHPRHERGCTWLGHRLRRAIAAAISHPITWVSHREAHMGVLWVLSPVVFRTRGRASFSDYYSRVDGCYGGDHSNFRWSLGAWHGWLFSGYAGCNVTT